MAYKTCDFDSPKTSLSVPIQYNGHIPTNTVGYMRLYVKASYNSGYQTFYRTITFSAPSDAPLNPHGTYNIAVAPRCASASIITATYAFSYTSNLSGNLE